MRDTRVIQALDNVKAGAACLDDARCSVHELLHETPQLSVVDQMLFDVIYTALEKSLRIVDRCLGGLTRIADRWVCHE